MSCVAPDPFRSDPRFAAARAVCAERLVRTADDLAGLGSHSVQALRDVAHRLYGTAASYGFDAVADRARALDAAARGGCAEAVAAASAALEAELRALGRGA